MKYPKKNRIYCPKCQTHTNHAAKIYKKGKERKKVAAGNRKYKRLKRGYGSQPKPIQHNQVKTNKKFVVQLKCSECGYTVQKPTKRMSKLEIEAK